MNVLGIDPSSSATGFAVVQHGAKPVITHTELWIPRALMHKDDWTIYAENLVKFQQRVTTMIASYKITHVVVEKVSVSMNPNTIRKIAYYESACMAGVERSNHGVAGSKVPEIRLVQASSARRHTLGAGGLSKEASAAALRALYPEMEEKSLDECDAVVLAIAAPQLF